MASGYVSGYFLSGHFCAKYNSWPVICYPRLSIVSSGLFLFAQYFGCSLFKNRKPEIQFSRLSFGYYRERAKGTSTPDKTSWNQNLEISLNQITALQNQIPGLCYQAKSPLSSKRWIRPIMIQHATHTHKIISHSWKQHLIQPNVPTRTSMFSNLSGLLIIVTAQETTFSSVTRVNTDQLINSSHRKSGRSRTYSSSCAAHDGKEGGSQCSRGLKPRWSSWSSATASQDRGLVPRELY